MGIAATTGLISGINTDQIITQLMNLEKQPITLLENRQKDYQVKIASFYDISTKLSSFKSALDALNNREKFNTKNASVTTSSSGVRLLNISASSSAQTGNYSIQVNQLATSSKKASQGWADQNTTAIAPTGGTFKFKVGSGGAETTIGVTNTMTLQGLRDAINSTSGGVTASLINDGTGSNPNRLILTSNNTGSSNTIYITQNTTNLDYTNKLVEAAYAYTTNSYSGTVASNAGSNYTGTTNKTFLMEVVAGGTPASGTAKYKYSIDGGITWKGANGAAYDPTTVNGVAVAADGTLQNIDGQIAGTTTEGAQIKFTGGTLAVGDRFTVDVFNPVMQAAQDAVINVDGATITKSTNTITDAIQGVTLNLLKADTSSTLTLSISSDTSSAQTSINDFVTAYNTMTKAINDQLSYDPQTKQANPLLGDPTLIEIRNKIGNAVTGRIPGLLSTGYQNLSQIGITSDYKTGKLSVDSSKLSSALNSNPDAVAKLFIGTATATNTAVSFVSKSVKTQAGVYSIAVGTAPQKAAIGSPATGPDDRNDLSTVGLGSDERLTFQYSSNKTSSQPTYTSFSATLTAGSTINTIVNTLNSTFATNKVGLSASNDSGKLKITAANYGSDYWFQVNNQKDDGTGTGTFVDYGPGVLNQIWASTSLRSNAGVDIIGSINGHGATGKGNTLTSTSGFPETGLVINIDSNQKGGFGTIAVSSGIADRLSSSIASYTDATSGIIKNRADSMQKSIDDLDAQKTRLNARIASDEQRLREQFARMETLLAQYNSTAQYLTNELPNLPTIQK